MLANSSRKTFRRGNGKVVQLDTSHIQLLLLSLVANMFWCLDSELTSGPHTGIPWQPGPRRGSALEADGDSILIREEGFYFVYSQVRPLSVVPGCRHKRAASSRLSPDRSSQKDALVLV